MPTGGGKSPAYVGAANITGKRTCIVTGSRGLQDQLMTDFACMGLVDIRGRANYKCDMREDYTCEDGAAARCPYKGSVGCEASKAEMKAAASHLVVTNYKKWTSSKKFGLGMTGFDQVIFDEAHEAPEELAAAMQVTISAKEVEKDLEIDLPENAVGCDMARWKLWASTARIVAETLTTAAFIKINGTGEPKSAWVKDYNHKKHLTRRLAVLAACNAKEWIVDEVTKPYPGFQFDPIRPARYAEAALLLRVPRIICVSATIRPKTLYMIGIGKEHSIFHEYASDFDPKRCPIYHVPTMRMDHRSPDLSMMFLRIDQILGRRMDRKGIIHPHSYDRRDLIVDNSRYGDIMLINLRGESVTHIIDTFKHSPPPMALVSPSVSTGYDFPGDQCEYQIVCKIPFPDGRSKIVKARQEDDAEYGPYNAMQTLVQTFGRGARSKQDRCENFITDDHIEWFRGKYAHLAPRTFHAFFQELRSVPPPPPKL